MHSMFRRTALRCSRRLLAGRWAGAAAYRSFSSGGQRPADVGITAMDITFPRQFVEQSEYESFVGVGAGKFTKGLGQDQMAFCSEAEDIYSLCLTAVDSFMRKNGLSYKDIGRLEVATETLLDHAKSIKTVLMQLFEEEGNSDVEGIDTYNACYGGTAALFNSAAWVESSAWDGRYALVVTADIAEYEAGPARPTCGAGAVVMLVGPDAPLVLEQGNRASHMQHVYDFWKPHLTSPFPEVDGAYSGLCYLQALDRCYNGLVQKSAGEVALTDYDFVSFHAPYNKLVSKSFARLLYLDYMRNPELGSVQKAVELGADATQLAQVTDGVAVTDSYTDRDLEKAFVSAAAPLYDQMVDPGTLLPRRLGNMYSAALYAGIMSVWANKGKELDGSRLLCFSYGSGLAATMFGLRCKDRSAQAVFGAQASDTEGDSLLTYVQETADVHRRLDDREKWDCAEFETLLDRKGEQHGDSRTPVLHDQPPTNMYDGAFYLNSKDERGRRQFARYSGQ